MSRNLVMVSFYLQFHDFPPYLYWGHSHSGVNDGTRDKIFGTLEYDNPIFDPNDEMTARRIALTTLETLAGRNGPHKFITDEVWANFT